MTPEPYTKRELDIFFKGIEEAIHNGVELLKIELNRHHSKIEEIDKRSMQNQADIKKYLEILSKHDNIIVGYKSERDNSREEIIALQSEKINILEKDKEQERKKILKYIILALLFIAGYVGLINPDLIKSII